MSILGAFSQINVPALPHPYPPFTLACRLRLDGVEAGNHELKVTVADPDGRILAQMKVQFTIGEKPPHLQIIFPVTGMQLRSTGDHMIDLILDGNPPVRTPFQVARLPA